MIWIKRLPREQHQGRVVALVSAGIHLGVLVFALWHSPFKSGMHVHLPAVLPIQVTLITLDEPDYIQPAPSTHDTGQSREAEKSVAAEAKNPKLGALPLAIKVTPDVRFHVEPTTEQQPPGMKMAQGNAPTASPSNNEAFKGQAVTELANSVISTTSSTDRVSLRIAQPDYAHNPVPDYPLSLREQGVGGVVWLRVWVETDGRPGEVFLVKSSGYRLLDESALHAVRHWRFQPAHNGEQALASWVEFPIRFSIQG